MMAYATKANGYWDGNTAGRMPGTGRPIGERRCAAPMASYHVKGTEYVASPICGLPHDHPGNHKSEAAYARQARRAKVWRLKNYAGKGVN